MFGNAGNRSMECTCPPKDIYLEWQKAEGSWNNRKFKLFKIRKVLISAVYEKLQLQIYNCKMPASYTSYWIETS